MTDIIRYQHLRYLSCIFEKMAWQRKKKDRERREGGKERENSEYNGGEHILKPMLVLPQQPNKAGPQRKKV